MTLKSLQGTSIEDYGYQLGRRWQIGQKDKNNGVLLIVAPNERKVRIEVGYGLEGTLTDAVTKLIIENSILPRFKVADFPGGIKRGVEDIIQVLSGDAQEWQDRAAQQALSGQCRSRSPRLRFGRPSLWFWSGVGLLIFCAIRGSVDLPDDPAVSCPDAHVRAELVEQRLVAAAAPSAGRRLLRGRRRLGKLVRSAR